MTPTAAYLLDIEAVVIASPCTVPWDTMSGDAVKRFCGQCRLHVHDTSQMTRDEARELLRATNGDCCVRIWRRPDGRVITKDCNRVRRALRRRLRVLAAAAAGLLALIGIGGCHRARVVNEEPSAGPKPPAPVPGAPEKPPVPRATVTMGK